MQNMNHRKGGGRDTHRERERVKERVDESVLNSIYVQKVFKPLWPDYIDYGALWL